MIKKESNSKLAKDAIFQQFTDELIRVYEKAIPFCVTRTKRGKLKVKYYAADKEAIDKAKNDIAEYLISNYDDMNCPF